MNVGRLLNFNFVLQEKSFSFLKKIVFNISWCLLLTLSASSLTYYCQDGVNCYLSDGATTTFHNYGTDWKASASTGYAGDIGVISTDGSIRVTSSVALAGAVASIQFTSGSYIVELISSGGHGSAFQHAAHMWGECGFATECDNPTEAGSLDDDFTKDPSTGLAKKETWGDPVKANLLSTKGFHGVEGSTDGSSSSRIHTFEVLQNPDTGAQNRIHSIVNMANFVAPDGRSEYNWCKPKHLLNVPSTQPMGDWLEKWVDVGVNLNGTLYPDIIRTKSRFVPGRGAPFADNRLIAYLNAGVFTWQALYNPRTDKYVDLLAISRDLGYYDYLYKLNKDFQDTALWLSTAVASGVSAADIELGKSYQETRIKQLTDLHQAFETEKYERMKKATPPSELDNFIYQPWVAIATNPDGNVAMGMMVMPTSRDVNHVIWQVSYTDASWQIANPNYPYSYVTLNAHDFYRNVKKDQEYIMNSYAFVGTFDRVKTLAKAVCKSKNLCGSDTSLLQKPPEDPSFFTSDSNTLPVCRYYSVDTGRYTELSYGRYGSGSSWFGGNWYIGIPGDIYAGGYSIAKLANPDDGKFAIVGADIPLYRCLYGHAKSGTYFTFVSKDEKCEGQVKQDILGYGWSSNTGGLKELARCFRSTPSQTSILTTNPGSDCSGWSEIIHLGVWAIP
ncbi:MAG: hypothetical protein KA116_02545 [Proteobacteria bacterium]|nr:hypothetical protein [Pseudomonadota bacterium]